MRRRENTGWYLVCGSHAMLHARRVLLCAVLLAGCQTKAPPSAPQTLDDEPEYEAVTAAALVFDPPVALDEPPLQLTRADREARVAVGYEELTAEYFYIRLDDRQITSGGSSRFGHGFGGGSYDRYERRAVTERVGVRYR